MSCIYISYQCVSVRLPPFLQPAYRPNPRRMDREGPQGEFRRIIVFTALLHCQAFKSAHVTRRITRISLWRIVSVNMPRRWSAKFATNFTMWHTVVKLNGTFFAWNSDYGKWDDVTGYMLPTKQYSWFLRHPPSQPSQKQCLFFAIFPRYRLCSSTEAIFCWSKLCVKLRKQKNLR